MQRKLLITGFVCCSLLAFAQKQKGTKQQTVENTTAKKDTTKVDYKSVGAPLPAMRVVTQKGKTYTNKDLKNDATLFVMLFNPTCEHCEEQTEIFKENIAMFKNTKLVLMAGSMMMPYLDFFENAHKVSEYPKIIVGIDSSGFIDKTFLYNNLPQINIYNKDRKLERIFTGNVPMDSLAKYIQ
ncbi:hypothetical protein [Taibaiella soli]|uniref:Thioredoxin domain-containing protein n=1 Tax=Taibaiella soli TaxID=1649169 RepID=A0A2W2A6M9_9BACT|nr:hypothetical protein [Taibaiella soli]PZF70935.1 hypothetical protein DN068_21150 [Taibaiella soli]